MPEETEVITQSFRAVQPEFLTQTKFDHFDLPTQLLAGLDEAGFKFCTPIQAQVLPASLAGKDIAGQAQTGTGKTAAFMVTIMSRLLNRTQKRAGMPSALIIAPTRELALQVYEDAQLFGKYTKLTQALAIGGIDYQEQADAIRKGPDIVICTPGRIIDYIKQGIFKTQAIEMLVIDEADRLFDLGFVKDLRFILKKLPHYEKRQSMLFSATLSYRVLELTYDYMNLPEFISITPQEVTVDRITQSLFHVGADEKFRLLLGILDREDWVRILIFVNTKAGVEWVTEKLKGNGLPTECITGDLPQPKRLKLMQRFKDGHIKILVATDVASRGIHVEDISHVINYDLPQDVENYVHRIGRTARAGKEGRAISLACEDYVFHLEALETMLGAPIPVVWHDDSWLLPDKAQNVRIARRGRPVKPRTRRDKPPVERQKSEPQQRPPVKMKEISRPGGIFGLAPRNPAVPLTEAAAEDPQKKKRKRRRRKKSTSDKVVSSDTRSEEKTE